MARFGYYCRKTRRHLIGDLPDWNCNCGEPNGICINSINKYDPKGMSHAGVRTALTRDFYHGTFDGNGEVIQSNNIISQKGLRLWRNGGTLTKDHAFTPQFFGRLTLDNPKIFLANTQESKEAFDELMYLASTIIWVTAEENTLLRGQTHNDGKTFSLECPTHLKYNKLGIKLLEKKDNETWKDAKPISNILNVPDILTQYEKKYLIKEENEHRSLR